MSNFKNKLLVMLAVFAVCVAFLASCKQDGNGSNGGTQLPGVSQEDNSNAFWSSGKDVYLILGEGIENVPSELETALFDTINRAPRLAPATTAQGRGQIIIGKTEHALSKTAYRYLSQTTQDSFEGYVIYTNGATIAVAYTGEDALDLAVNDLKENILLPKDGKLVFDTSVLSSYEFNLNAYYDELDETARENAWVALEKTINDEGFDGEATVKALKQLYSLYSDDAYIWLANLYDPDIDYGTRGKDDAKKGGFYYSNSARNTISFLPDVESTRQAIDLIRYSGMTGNIRADLPKEMQDAMVTFVRSLYDSESGKYYHPQWAHLTTTDERLGRDYSNAKTVLNAFGAKQTVTSAVSSVVSKKSLPGYLSTTKADYVSKVVATSSVPHLTSEKAFLEYLNSQNWDDSYTSGNRIAAQSALIDEAGLMEVCLNFFDSIQNPYTGMWSPSRDDNAVNGFLKISAIYADYAPKYGRTIHYASEAAETCELVLLSEVDPSTVCWVYNVWYSLGNIIGLLNKTGKASDAELAITIRDRLRKNAATYIEIAAQKYTPFRKDDGSFSFTPGKSSSNSQGMPVCVSNRNEGDVNATYISIISVPGRIFAALDYPSVDIYTPNDMKVFVNEVSSMGAVIKSNTEFGGALKFNGDTLDGLFYSTAYVELDTEPGNVVEKGYAYAYVEDGGGTNNFLTFGKDGQSITENGTKVEPKIAFRTIESGGTRYIYEAKVRFNGGEMEGNSWHTRFSMYYGSGRFWYMLAYTNGDGQLCLDSLNEPIAVLDPGVWYTLRFEYYKDSAENATDKICKVFVNGEYVGDGGVAGSAGKDTTLGYSYIEFRCQATNLSWSLDDINTTTDDESYVAPPPPDFGDANGTYYTDATIKKDRYDYDVEDPKLPVLGYKNNSAEMTVDSENGTLVFKKVSGASGEESIKFTSSFSDAFWKFTNKATIVEFDLKYKNITATTPMKWRFGKDIVVSKSGDSLVMSMPLVAGNSSFDLGTLSDTWYNFRLEQYWYKHDAEGNTYSLIKVFVNDVYKGEFKTTYDSATSNFLLYILASETTAELTMDNILVANIDKPYVSENISSGGDNPGASDEEYVPSAEILAVKGGAGGVVVLMHDDGDINSARILDTLYAKYGVKGDVAMVVSNLLQAGTTAPEAVTVNYWKQLINTGRWNIVNHSYTHTWWGDNTSLLEKELITSQSILRNLFNTQRVLTFAYPGFSAKVNELGKDAVYSAAYDIIANYYIGARDYEGRTTSLSGIDWLDVNSCSIGESWASSAMNDINAAIEGGKMAVVFMHKVVETDAEATADTSATTKAKMEEIISKISAGAKDGKIWNAFFEEAILYLREAECASVNISGDANEVKVNLNDTLADSTYNYPLTVRIEVPASWLYVKMSQGTRNEYLTAYNLDGKWVVDANIVPDGGEASLISIEKHDIPIDTSVETPKEEMLEIPPFDAGDATGDYFKDPDNAGLRVDFDSILTNIPEDTDASDFLTIKDGYLLFDDGEAEDRARYIRYRYDLPSGYSSFASLCTIFEFDMNLKQAYSSYPIQIKLADTMYTIYYPKVDGVNKLCMQVDKVDIPLGITMNTWATIRFEHYYSVTHADGTTTGVLQVYVNNEAVLEIRTDVKSANNAALIYMTRVERKSASDADLKLDNIFLGHFNKPYEAIVMEKPEPAPTPTPDPTPEPPVEDASGDYFLAKKEGAVSGTIWDFDVAGTSIPSSNSAGGTGSLSVNEGSLYFEDGDAENAGMFVKFWRSYPASYNCSIIEFDFKLNQVYGTSPMEIFVNGTNKAIFYTKIDGVNYLTMDDESGNKVILGVSLGEWANIRIEQYKDLEKAKIYINNEFVMDTNWGYNYQDSFRIQLTANERNTGSNADLWIDNVYVGHITKDYVSGASVSET